jgi:hypothetical protein
LIDQTAAYALGELSELTSWDHHGKRVEREIRERDVHRARHARRGGVLDLEAVALAVLHDEEIDGSTGGFCHIGALCPAAHAQSNA